MGLISRLKQWIFQEDVASADLNGEFDNILNNLDAAHVVGDSASVGQMQTMTSPGGVGSESLAANTSGEIERLRFVIQRIMGTSAPQWYSVPPIDLTTALSLLPNTGTLQTGVSSGAVDANGQPMWLIPNGAAASVTLKCSVTPMVAYINGTQYTFNADITLAGLTTAPGSNNTATIGNSSLNASIASDTFSKNAGEEDSPDVLFGRSAIDPFINLSAPGSSITAKNNTLVAMKITHGGNSEYVSGFLRNSATRFEMCQRGAMFNSSSVAIPRVAYATGDTVTLMNLSWIFLLSNGTLDVTYNRPSVGAQTPLSPATGDYWFNSSTNQWLKYNGTSFVANASVLVGVCGQDSSNCVFARSADAVGSYVDTHNIVFRVNPADQTKAISDAGGSVSVYGKTLSFSGMNLDFSISRDKSGSFSNGDQIFLYLDKTGKQFIDNIAPNKRLDLGGYYHPSRPYRCLASCFTDGTNFSLIASQLVNVLNLKKPSAFSSRAVTIATQSNLSTTSSVSIGTAQVWMRGGRLKATLFSPAGSIFSASNSGANVTTGAINVTVTDDFGNTNQVQLQEVLGQSSGAANTYPVVGANYIFGGCGFVSVSATLTASAFAGTPTASLSVGASILLEEVF